MKYRLLLLTVLGAVSVQSSYANDFLDRLRAQAEKAQTYLNNLNKEPDSDIAEEADEQETEEVTRTVRRDVRPQVAPRSTTYLLDHSGRKVELLDKDSSQERSVEPLDEKLLEYQNSPMVNHTLEFMHQKVEPQSVHLCATYVRKGLMESGLIPKDPKIGYARNYLPYFKKEGWTNLVETSPRVRDDLMEATPGCAIVYDGIDARNGSISHIGHIELRTKQDGNDGFISDYYGKYPVTGFVCAEPGKVVKKLKTYIARKDSPFYKAGEKVELLIDVTECNKYVRKAALISDEWANFKVTGVFCKLN